MYHSVWSTRFSFCSRSCNIASSASTAAALLAEEIACELMAEESDPIGLVRQTILWYEIIKQRVHLFKQACGTTRRID